MEYRYEMNAENRTITVTTKGDLTNVAVAKMGIKILTEAKALNYKVAFDYRLSKNTITIAEAYFYYTNSFDIVDIRLRFVPVAYLVQRSEDSFYSFFESTCKNKSVNIHVFYDEQEWLSWMDE